MKLKNISLSSSAALVAVSLLLASPVSLRSWDQFGVGIFNSHTILTSRAIRGANATLWARRDEDINQWLTALNKKKAVSIAPRGFKLDKHELQGGFYQIEDVSNSTLMTSNKLQLGNTAADWPARLNIRGSSKSGLFRYYCDFWTETSNLKLPDTMCSNLNPTGLNMPIHFLRAYVETGGIPAIELDTARESCAKSIGIIHRLTAKAMEQWKRGNNTSDKAEALRAYELMYFALGTAVHAIEDSFAPSHTQRSADNPRIITNLCYYYDNSVLPPSETDACVHEVGLNADPRDSIHFTGNAKYPESTEKLADLASQVSKAYLTGFAETALDNLTGKSTLTSEDFVNEFLINGNKEGQGYFDCAALTK